MKTAFFGAGNMGGAIIRAAVSSGAAKAEDIIVFDKNTEAVKNLSDECGIKTAECTVRAAKSADILFIAVKPGIVPSVMKEIADCARDKITVSIAAGVTIDTYKKYLGEDAKIVRTIPNMPAMVGEGITGIYFENFTAEDEEKRKCVLGLFNSFGRTVTVKNESMIDEMVAVTSSSPAYVCLMIEAMADTAVKFGFTRDEAYMMAEQAVLGTAKLMLDKDIHPAVLKDRICSPGGTTIEAVESLEASGFRACLSEAMQVCRDKTFYLGGKSAK